MKGKTVMLRNETNVLTKLQRIEEIAQSDKTVKFTSLAHLLVPELLHHALGTLNKHGAAGVDDITMKQFLEDKEEQISLLHREMKEQKYRATSVRRAYIPKQNGKLRPLGIPTIRDRVAQKAVAEILNRIYEPEFLDVSYGFRPQRSAHDALAAIRKEVHNHPVKWIVDIDIRGYFDHISHEWMIKFIRHRVADNSILRLVAKWLKAGILENGVNIRSEEGVPQGGPISPLLANIYLHYVLDLWFEKKYRRQCRGYAFMVRYADDFVVGFEHQEEAQQFLNDLKVRLEKFQLQIAEEKTQIVAFGRYSSEVGNNGPAAKPRTFDFLGFTHYMKPRNRGSSRQAVVARKPKRASRNKFLSGIKDWLRKCMHLSTKFHRAVLSKKLKGYYNYFGLPYCGSALRHVRWHVQRIWLMTLRRRGQKHKLWWRNMNMEQQFWLPHPS